MFLALSSCVVVRYAWPLLHYKTHHIDVLQPQLMSDRLNVESSFPNRACALIFALCSFPFRVRRPRFELKKMDMRRCEYAYAKLTSILSIRIRSSNSLLLRPWNSLSSSKSCRRWRLGCSCGSCRSLASRRSCSAVICTVAGSLFFTLGARSSCISNLALRALVQVGR